ncbi:MAG: cysteine desulfurase family protein [Pirellulales bacterium]
MTGMDPLIYLDHNATTPMLPEVVDAMRACYETPYFNPASQHEPGRRARRKLEDARERIGELLGARVSAADADTLLFTSGGTEANNLALFGLGEGRFSGPGSASRHIIVSSIEHPSIATSADELARGGWQVDRLGVDERGLLRGDRLSELLRPETRLVAVMLGQNETGVLQPVAELAAICAQRGVPCHTDAAQVVGKLPVDFRALGVTTLSAAAHKFHGPLGVGVLIVRHGTELRPQSFGGFQQNGLRPGTESVALAVGMCRALELWHADRDARAVQLRQLRDRFEAAILQGWPNAVVIGRGAPRLPQTSNIAFVGLERQALFMALDQAGVACSTGSACASGSSEPSPALVAMGCERSVVTSALRFSLGITTTEPDIAEAARRILRCCNELGRRNRA